MKVETVIQSVYTVEHFIPFVIIPSHISRHNSTLTRC